MWYIIILEENGIHTQFRLQVTAACRYAQLQVYTAIVRSLSSTVVHVTNTKNCAIVDLICLIRNVIEMYKTV